MKKPKKRARKPDSQRLVEKLTRAVELIEEAHDTHIWDADDNHPTAGCAYCNFTRSARRLLRIVDKS